MSLLLPSKRLGQSVDHRLSDSTRFLRHFIVDGFQKIAPGVDVISVPLEITSLRECQSQAELALLQYVNEAVFNFLWLSRRNLMTVLAIRAVQKRMYIGIRESQVRQLIDRTLAVAGVTDRWALVLFGVKRVLITLIPRVLVDHSRERCPAPWVWY